MLGDPTSLQTTNKDYTKINEKLETCQELVFLPAFSSFEHSVGTGLLRYIPKLYSTATYSLSSSDCTLARFLAGSHPQRKWNALLPLFLFLPRNKIENKDKIKRSKKRARNKC